MKQLGTYSSEIEGMEDFWNDIGVFPDYSCNTDGYYNGYLIEFKLDNFDTEKVKSQLMRYVKSRNAAGKELPRYGIGICINKGTYQLYDLLKDQEKEIVCNSWSDVNDFLNKINIKGTKITQKGWIDETSIVSYNDLFYSLTGKTSKDSFIKELANPTFLNIIPYSWNEVGEMERKLLDCLGSNGLKKRMGAFFTPDYAVEKSTSYIRDIINSLNKSKDYVIIDRCAGTGNLEKFLTEEELSHCILNTITYAEWTTLKGLYEGRVRKLFPENDSSLNSIDGLLKDGDALSKEFYDKLFPLTENKTVIMLENPPYSEPQAEATRSGETIKGTSKNYITEQMKLNKINGVTARDMANKFIWSGFNLIKADYYVVYSPVKYFKSQNLVNKKFIEGRLVNRKDFHATEAAISIMSWKNEDETVNEWKLENATVKRVKKSSAELLPSDPANHKPLKLDNYDFIITSPAGTPDFKHGCFCNTEEQLKKAAGNATSIAAKLKIETYGRQAAPLFAANCYTCKDFTEKEVIMKSSDKGLDYLQDNNFVNDCLIWIGLTDKNKCISDATIKNQCCINQATKLDALIDSSIYSSKAREIKSLWDIVLAVSKTAEEYNPNYNYGLFQIEKDLNIKIPVIKANGQVATDKAGKEKTEHKYPALNTAIAALKKELVKYYDAYITPKLFEYELLK